MKILHLNLKKEYYDQIVAGIKTTEYRELKNYWTKRLVNKNYDLICFKNGYSKNAPKFHIQYKGYTIEKRNFEITQKSTLVYAIKLGDIINHNTTD